MTARLLPARNRKQSALQSSSRVPVRHRCARAAGRRRRGQEAEQIDGGREPGQTSAHPSCGSRKASTKAARPGLAAETIVPADRVGAPGVERLDLGGEAGEPLHWPGRSARTPSASASHQARRHQRLDALSDHQVAPPQPRHHLGARQALRPRFCLRKHSNSSAQTDRKVARMKLGNIVFRGHAGGVARSRSCPAEAGPAARPRPRF